MSETTTPAGADSQFVKAKEIKVVALPKSSNFYGIQKAYALVAPQTS